MRSILPVRTFLVFTALVMVCTLAASDSITVGGKSYEDVYVRESDSFYFVQLPWDGSVLSEFKSAVDKNTVGISEDHEYRATLLAEWKENNAKRRGIVPVEALAKSSRGAPALSEPVVIKSMRPTPIKGSNPVRRPPAYAAEIVTNGRVRRVNLREVSLKDALKALLRPMNLDYAVKNGYVWISTPQKIRTESFQELETRYYKMRNSGANTMPKIVVQNLGGYSGGGASGFSGGFGSGGGGFGGGQGGFGGGQGGFGGGQGGFGGGQGGFGGGQGGFGGGATVFSNISDLFRNIDDRMVGEAPAVINPVVIAVQRVRR